MDYVLILLPKVPQKPKFDLAVKDKDGIPTGELREKTAPEIALEVDYSTKKQAYEAADASAFKDFSLTGRYKTILGSGPTFTDADKKEYTAQWLPAARFRDPAGVKNFIESWSEKEKEIPGLQVAVTNDPKAWLIKAGFSPVIPADAGIQ